MPVIISYSLSAIDLALAVAVRTNCVRVTFDEVPYFSNVLDAHDAANPALFSVVPVSGSPNTVRTVSIVLVTKVDGDSFSLDLWLDRPLSGYPAQYQVTCANLIGATTSDPIGVATATFYGTIAKTTPNTPELAISLGDIAQPQDLAALLDPLPTTDPLLLGAIPVDSLGDYASDEGITSYRKRVWRRLITREGGFAHLGEDYGVGILSETKKLATPQVRARLAHRAESQIKREPETKDCRVTFRRDDGRGLWYVTAICAVNFGSGTVSIDTAFAPIG